MTAVVRIVRVFVSSPGDCEAERVVLDEVVQRINETPPTAGVRVELFKWERNVAPQIGPPAQKVVDDQTPACGIYLGIMRHRFGTPTGKHGSGTEKEFRDSLKRWAKLGEPWILFYFSDEPVNPAQLDLAQYAKVRAFRDELKVKGLSATYTGVRGNSGAFFDKVEQRLRMIIPRLASLEQPRRRVATPGGKRRTNRAAPIKPLV